MDAGDWQTGISFPVWCRRHRSHSIVEDGQAGAGEGSECVHIEVSVCIFSALLSVLFCLSVVAGHIIYSVQKVAIWTCPSPNPMLLVVARRYSSLGRSSSSFGRGDNEDATA